MLPNIYLFVLEGLDCSGKSTQFNLLRDRMNLDLTHFYYFKEPMAQDDVLLNLQYNKTQTILKNLFEQEKDPLKQMLLLSLSRSHLLSGPFSRIFFKACQKPNHNFVIIMDRYLYSTLAYQNFPDIALSLFHRANINKIATDLVFFLDIKPEEVARRLTKKPDLDIIEQGLSPQRLTEIKKNYDTFFGSLLKKNQLVNIDANREIEDIYSEISSTMLKFIKDNK